MDNVFKCFKIAIIISLTWIIGLVTIKISLKASELSFITSVDDVEEITFDENIIEIKKNKDMTLYISNTKSYLYENELILELEDRIIDFDYHENIYLITNNKLLKYNYKVLKEIELNNTNLKDIYIDDEYIYLAGSKENDAYFAKLTFNLEIIEENMLGGQGKEEFINIYVLDNTYYLVGKKDSISNNSPFKNVGKPNTEKIFMISYFEDILQEIYFNSVESKEELVNVIYNKDIYILLSSKEIFRLDYELNVLPSKKIDYSFDNIFIDSDNNLATYKIQNNKLFINNYFVLEDDLFCLTTDNQLVTYTIDKGKITIKYLFTYLVIKNEELICDKNNFDLSTLSNLEIYSPFEKLEKRILDSSIINKQVHGTYDILYILKRPNNKTFYINGILKIKPYINIINNGVYRIGKELKFFGKAFLNNKEIYNGHVIKNTGTYILKLLNNKNEETTYTFNVIDNYYKECEIVDYQTDYEIKQGETVSISILMKNFKEDDIKEIIINDTSYTNFEIINDEIKVYLNSDETYKINSYYFNKIILNSGEEIIINKSITVKTLKKNSNVILNQSLNNKTIILEYEITDTDKTFMYLKTNIFQNNELLTSFNNYFNGTVNQTSENLPNEKIVIEQILVYHNGKSLKELKLCEYSIDKLKEDYSLEMSYRIDNSLKNITINIDTSKYKLSNLKINETNILDKIDLSIFNNQNEIMYLVILISFLLFSISLIILKIKQKRKTKQTD